MNTFEHISQETEQARVSFLATPMLLSAANGKIDTKLYTTYLEQTYHHVKHTCPLLAASMAQCTKQDHTLRQALIEYIDEEKNHEEWILNDISHIDPTANLDQIRGEDGGTAVEAMIAYMYYLVEHKSPYAMLGMIFVLEGTSTDLATMAANSISNSLGIKNNKGFIYLRSHGAVDIEHIEFYQNLVNKITDTSTIELIIKSASSIYKLWSNVFIEVVQFWENSK